MSDFVSAYRRSRHSEALPAGQVQGNGVIWYSEDWQPARPRRPLTPLAGCVLVAAAMALWAVTALWTARAPLAPFPEETQTAERTHADRFAEVSTEVDAISRQLLASHISFDARLTALRQRQLRLEKRQGQVDSLLKAAGHPVLRATARAIRAHRVPVDSAPLVTGSLTDGKTGAKTGGGESAGRSAVSELRLSFVPAGTQQAPAQPAAQADSEPGTDTADTWRDEDAQEAILRLAKSQDQLETTQLLALELLEEKAAAASAEIEKVIIGLGFDPMTVARLPQRIKPVFARAAMGGPFVPLLLGTSSAKPPFDRRVRELHDLIQTTTGLYKGLEALPVRAPLAGEQDISSGYGRRRDPFHGSLAMHSGVDFRAATGTPVRATAPGIVTYAGRQGGYGNVIEIQHPRGISTRYAHLSHIAVQPGQQVQPGQAIGSVGSTGRSTGPHLHYELEINEQKTDPARFLRAAGGFARLIKAN
jgi:murein DD-endopeptidase MepM/ murein hydrolase activator NlpD